MPEEDISPDQPELDASDNQKGNKYKKILFLFRSNHKETDKTKGLDKMAARKKKKKEKKKRCANSDERKEMFQRNMEASWTELPNTLKRKKEKISQAILSEFHDPEAETDFSSLRSAPSDHFLKTREKEALKPGLANFRNYILGGMFSSSSEIFGHNPDGFKNTCEYFRSKPEEKTSKGLDAPCKSSQYVNDEKLMVDGQLSLEKIRKLTDEQYENKEDVKKMAVQAIESQKGANTCTARTDRDDVYEPVAAPVSQSVALKDKKTCAGDIFYDVILDNSDRQNLYEKSNRNKIESWINNSKSPDYCNYGDESLDSGRSDTYVSQSIIFQTRPIIHYTAETEDTQEHKHKQEPKQEQPAACGPQNKVDKMISNGSGFQEIKDTFKQKDSPLTKKSELRRSTSSDSLLNDSSVSSSSSEVSQHDDSGAEVGCKETHSKPFKEMISDFEKICTQNLSKSNASKKTEQKNDANMSEDAKGNVNDIERSDKCHEVAESLDVPKTVEYHDVCTGEMSHDIRNEGGSEELRKEKECHEVQKTEGGRQERKKQHEYSDIVFSAVNAVPPNSQGFFVNKEFQGDLPLETASSLIIQRKNSCSSEYQIVTDHKIVYQELDFVPPDRDGGYEEPRRAKHIYEEPMLSKDGPLVDNEYSKKSLSELKNCFENVQKQEPKRKTSDSKEKVEKCEITCGPSHLSEDEKAKKKSAEAIAKELSMQIFAKKGIVPKVSDASSAEDKEGKEPKTLEKHREEFLKNLGYDCNSKPADSSIVDSAKKIVAGEYMPMKGLAKPKEDCKLEDEIKEEKNEELISKHEELVPAEDVSEEENTGQTSEELSEEEKEKEPKGGFGGDLQYFSVAEWRKAVAMGSKRGINSLAMETIVEEPETDTATKLTVREILRRFEELGNKHFSDKCLMSDEERSATLKQIHETLKCLEEKVRSYETRKAPQNEINSQLTSAWTGRGPAARVPQSTARGNDVEEELTSSSVHDGKHSLLQFAIHHFRQSPEKFEMLKSPDGSISGSLKVLESKNKKNKEKGSKGSGGGGGGEWTWKEQVDLVKFTPTPIDQSLLRLDSQEMNELAVECFVCLMRYMGDLPMPTDVSEVKCVYTILMHCHKLEQLRDEVYCQLMKQTTNNKSAQPESCQRGWRLFSIVAAYFISSDTLKPFLFKYLETAAYDKRRAYHGTATVCLQNLRKTFKYGGRKNVPSVEEITAISAGRNSKRQIYRLPGGTEKVVNTKSTTVVQDVVEELCLMINVPSPQEMEEFSVYCIVEGDTFTMPLAREEYILDVTTELHKNHQVFYLIFCRSVWFFPLRLDSQLYVEVVFNQIAPDYLEGLLVVMPGETLEQDVIYDISKMAALLHRAADMTHIPTMKETKFLLPKPALSVRDVKPSQWVNMVQSNWEEAQCLTAIQAKAQVLEVLSKWPLFGSSFFAVKKVSEPKERTDHILALNRHGVHFIDLVTHETLVHYPFSEVISTRKVKSEDGTLFLDMKCGNLMQQRITRLQTDQAHEISRLIRQYITMQQRLGQSQ